MIAATSTVCTVLWPTKYSIQKGGYTTKYKHNNTVLGGLLLLPIFIKGHQELPRFIKSYQKVPRVIKSYKKLPYLRKENNYPELPIFTKS